MCVFRANIFAFEKPTKKFFSFKKSFHFRKYFKICIYNFLKRFVCMYKNLCLGLQKNFQTWFCRISSIFLRETYTNYTSTYFVHMLSFSQKSFVKNVNCCRISFSINVMVLPGLFPGDYIKQTSTYLHLEIAHRIKERKIARKRL